MILVQGILDELRHQAELQGKKNYRCIEVDWRVIIALCDEIEASRSKLLTEKAADSGKTTNLGLFIPGETVVFQGKEYDFGYYSKEKETCILYGKGCRNMQDSFLVCVKDVSMAPL